MTNQEHQENGNGAGDEIVFQQSQGPVGQQFGEPGINPEQDESRSQENQAQGGKKSFGLGREAAPPYETSYETSHNNQESTNSKGSSGHGEQVIYQQSQGPEGQQFGKPAIDPVELEHQQDNQEQSGKTEGDFQSKGQQEYGSYSGENAQREQTAPSKEYHGSSSEGEVLYQQSQGPEGQQFGKPAVDPTQIESREGDSSGASREQQTDNQKANKPHNDLQGEGQKSSSLEESPGSNPHKDLQKENQKNSSHKEPSDNKSQHNHPPHGKHNKDHSHDQEKTSKESKWAASAVGSENQADHGESQSPYNHLDNKPQKAGNEGEKLPSHEHISRDSQRSENEGSERATKSEGKSQKSDKNRNDLGLVNQPAHAHHSKGSSKPEGDSHKSNTDKRSSQSAAQQSHGQAEKTRGSSKKNVEPFERETHKFEDDSEKTHQDTKWAQSAIGNEIQFDDEHSSDKKDHSHKTSKDTSSLTSEKQKDRSPESSKDTSGLKSGNQSSRNTAKQGSHGQSGHSQSTSSKKNVEPFERETHKFEDDAEKTHQDTKWAQSAIGNEVQFDELEDTSDKKDRDEYTTKSKPASQSQGHKSLGQDKPRSSDATSFQQPKSEGRAASSQEKSFSDDKSASQPRSNDQEDDESKNTGENEGLDPAKVIGGGLAGVAATAAGAGVIGTVAGMAAGAVGVSKLEDKLEEHEAKKQAA